MISLHVMPVDLDHVPSERRPLGAEGVGIQSVPGHSHGLEAIPVQKGDDMVKFTKRREHRGFPNLAFVDFAVAQDDEYVESSTPASCAPKAIPFPMDKPWPSEPGVGFHPGRLGEIRVALKD